MLNRTPALHLEKRVSEHFQDLDPPSFLCSGEAGSIRTPKIASNHTGVDIMMICRTQ